MILLNKLILKQSEQNMSPQKEINSELISQYKLHKKDTGSIEVQVAILTYKIKQLSDHLKVNKKDYASQSGLLKMIGKRKRLLNYLNNQNTERYFILISRLGIRHMRSQNALFLNKIQPSIKTCEANLL
uniref:30S ribosomal protein S15 n=1 Tax=Glaucocystis incrassata TaxID=1789788 RepID=A0A3G1IVA2_9EUKA|nr:ribosomal protein S15 [Glaucocystis incrassata]ASQ39975.1 ribosomal protein S15 [Glaucocystis incrassata]